MGVVEFYERHGYDTEWDSSLRDATDADRDRRLLMEAYDEAVKSGDQSTQIGVVLYDPVAYKVVARGRNDIPDGCLDLHERRVAPLKYPWVHHAEMWGITNAARNGVKTDGLVMYATWAACGPCAGCIAQSGIKKLVRHVTPHQKNHPAWAESCNVGDQLLSEAGVEIVDVEHPMGVSIRFNRQLVQV